MKKSCFLGGGSVGKTSLLDVAVGRGFSSHYQQSEVTSYYLYGKDGCIVACRNVPGYFWNLQKVDALTLTNALSDIDTLVFCCDVISLGNFSPLPDWNKLAMQYVGDKPITKVFVVNKIDEEPEERWAFTRAQVTAMAKEIGCSEEHIFYTSAKTGTNVVELFDFLSGVTQEKQKAPEGIFSRGRGPSGSGNSGGSTPPSGMCCGCNLF